MTGVILLFVMGRACAPVLTSPILADTMMPLMLPDTDWSVWLHNSRLELLDCRVGEFSVLCLRTGDMDALEWDALGACVRDVGILDGDEGWLCLWCSLRLGNSGDNSVAAGLNCQGLGHCRGFVWDPGTVPGQCLHVCMCCDCLCVMYWLMIGPVVLSGLELESGIAGQIPGK